MAHLIDKAALVAEIERLRMNYGRVFNEYDAGFSEGRSSAFDEVLSFLNTLEVKETGTENHINCKVGWYDGVFLDYTQEQLSTLLDKIGANVGDEVKIYITK